ncbi:putative leucine-rich repeat domain superfamily [Helianthus annuus]|nr:putative leucine-rich repeat domain superfamily [Helianthus annuus]
MKRTLPLLSSPIWDSSNPPKIKQTGTQKPLKKLQIDLTMADRSLFTELEHLESPLVRLCIEAATQSADAVESWRRQRRTLERLPSQLAEPLLHRLLRRRLLYPSLLEVFKYSVEKIDLRGESSVDAEWMAYLGAFQYLSSLNVSDCHRINSSALWALSGMRYLKEVDLSRCSKVDDAGIKHLLSIRTIEILCISETSVTTNGVTLLSSLKRLSKLDLGGLFITDTALASLQVLTNLQHLDLWGSDISNEEYLDLSGNLVGDDSVTFIASVGANLKSLNLSKTRVSSAGVAVLVGRVPKLETISLDFTPTDDLAISYIGMMPSLKAVSMKGTNVRGVIQQNAENTECVLSLTVLENLKHLEKLNIEETALKDEAIIPISNLKQLTHLSLRSSFLTDASLHHLSSIPNLINLSMRDAILTNTGIESFTPPPSLQVLDLTGCWLLTKDALLSFVQLHSDVEVRHALVTAFLSDKDENKCHSPFMGTAPQRRFSSSPLKPEMAAIIDQRLKYSRAELLSMQFASTSVGPSSDPPTSPK